MPPVSELETSTHTSVDSLASETPKTFKVPTTPVDGKGEVVAFIGPGVEFKGEIRYQGSVQIDGLLEGEIHTDGTLLIGEKAVINARISAGSVISKGKITGDVVATEKVQLLSTAVMDGTLKTPKLSMEIGVVFNGDITMRTGDAVSEKKPENKIGHHGSALQVMNTPKKGKATDGSPASAETGTSGSSA
ncbi:MAG: polymer-forming cytoskeletal protein [Nitrospirae bacterium]|nr:MAG: polymer-forming cytoskeletal protein [Nitrospirota bacterium]